MFSKRFIAASSVALTSFASSAGEPPAALAAADPAAPVAPTSYTSAFSSYLPAKAPDVSPDKVWREANLKVAGEGMHGHGHGAPAPAARDAGAHAGHGAPARPAGDSAHTAQPMAPVAKPDPRAGHRMAPAAKPDPHAGHHMNHDEKPAAAARPVPARQASDAASHDQHQHHAKEAKQ